MDELNELREQMAQMKNSLEKSKINNARLMRSVMRARYSWLNTLFKAEIICAPFLVLLIAAECVALNVSLWFAVLFLIGLIIDTAVDFKTARISSRDIATLDVLSLRRKLVRQKKLRFRQFMVSVPLSLLWVALFLYSGFRNNTPEGEEYSVIGLIITLLIVSAICSVICIVLYRKMQRTNDELIAEIDSDFKD